MWELGVSGMGVGVRIGSGGVESRLELWVRVHR